MEPERLPELAEAYGLGGPIEDVRSVSPRFAHVLVFRMAGHRLLAKPGYQGWDEEHRRLKFGIQDYLHDVGYPIPKVHKTLSGEPIWDPEGDGVVLTDYVGHEHDPSRKRVQCAAMARVLGWFHRVGPGAPDLGTHYWDEDAGFEYSQSHVRMSRDWLRAKGLGAESHRRATEVLEELTATFEGVRSRLVAQAYWELPHIPIHGEFHQYHCRYEGDQVAAVVDWDTVRLAPRLHDVSRAIDIGVGWSASVEDPYAFRWHLTEVPTVGDIVEWMEAYLEFGPPLSRREIELFPYVCAAMWGTAGCPGVPRSDADMEHCGRVVDFMRFWVREASAIQDALAS